MLCYNKLWKLLIDRDMKKQDLRAKANLSSSSLSKMAHGQNINTELIVRICQTLNCDICDIVEFVPQKREE